VENTHGKTKKIIIKKKSKALTDITIPINMTITTMKTIVLISLIINLLLFYRLQ